MKQNTYLVSISLIMGDVVKPAVRYLVVSKHPTAVSAYAICTYASNPERLKWTSDCKATEFDDSLAYSATARLVPEEDLSTLKKYNQTIELDFSELHKSGNYVTVTSHKDYHSAVGTIMADHYSVDYSKSFNVDSVISGGVKIDNAYAKKESVFDVAADVAKAIGMLPRCQSLVPAFQTRPTLRTV